jgi:hypothetical protein
VHSRSTFFIAIQRTREKHAGKTSGTIFPDYTSITLPYNIAPINFMVEDGSEKIIAHFSSKSGKKITVKSSNNKIEIPVSAWKKLLSANKVTT